MANVIYRGPVEVSPRTINLPLAGAYLPGSFVESDGATLTQATTALGQRVHILGNTEFLGQDIATAYASGDTGVAYEVLPGQKFQARMAAATYAKGDPLTVAASGRLAVATAETVVVAFFDGTAGAVSAGDLADVTIANGYTVPAA